VQSPEVALSGGAAKADLSPEGAPKRTSVDHFEFMGYALATPL